MLTLLTKPVAPIDTESLPWPIQAADRVTPPRHFPWPPELGSSRRNRYRNGIDCSCFSTSEKWLATARGPPPKSMPSRWLKAPTPPAHMSKMASPTT